MGINIGISFVVAVGAYLLSDKLLKRAFPGAPDANYQRHVYSVVLSVVALFVSLSFTTLIETRGKVTAIGRMFGSISASPISTDFQTIFEQYHVEFRSSEHSHLSSHWVHSAISKLSAKMAEGSVFLLEEDAIEEIFRAHKEANYYVISTHVGDLDDYSGSDQYALTARDTSNRNIPIIRFYIFEGTFEDRPSRDSDVGRQEEHPFERVFVDNEDRELSEYNSQVGDLHNTMGALLSVVVPLETSSSMDRFEVHLIDGLFVVETDYRSGTTHARGTVSATGVKDKVRKKKEYLSSLLAQNLDPSVWNVDSQLVHHLGNSDVENRFPGYVEAVRSQSNDWPLAKRIAYALLEESE